MKILFTGASSFTGFWFVKELVNAGHEVITTYTKSDLSQYEDIRKERVAKLSTLCEQVYNCQFGSSKFVDLIKSGNEWDLLCHHAADVTDYKSPKFDYIKALDKNTFNLSSVFENLLGRNCDTILLTGSVFENDEGKGSDNLRAFSLYGLSKSLSYSVFRYYSQLFNTKLGKFVIPNPFGPFEEPRFTTYLIKTWSNNKIASVNTPDYVRDNIHVSLLAKTYVNFVEKLMHKNNKLTKINPSQYAESQGKFAQRFSEEMKKRIHLDCRLKLKEQKEFTEPKVRINTQNALDFTQDWDEKIAWDELAEYYRRYL